MIPKEIQGSKLSTNDSTRVWRVLKANKMAMPMIASFYVVGEEKCSLHNDGECVHSIILQTPVGKQETRAQEFARVVFMRRDTHGDWHLINRGVQSKDLGDVLRKFKEKSPKIAQFLFPRFA